MTHSIVTGATGLIGRWLVPELSRRGDVVAIVRRATERAPELRTWIARHGGDPARVRFVDGDLAAPGLGLNADARALVTSARDVFHGGALMQFGMTEEVARPANVAGTRELVALALASPALRRFVLISGFKIGDDVAFRELGIDPEAPYDAAPYDRLYRRLGAYEASKLEADHVVRDAARHRGLPLVRVHPGAVIGDSRTGETTQLFGFAPLVEAVWRGQLPAIPGDARHWLPLVSVDFLAQLLARIPDAPSTRGGNYIVLDDSGPQLVEMLARIAERTGARAPTRRIPVGLAKWLARMHLVPGGPAQAEGLGFLGDRRYDTSSTRRLATELGLAWPSITDAIDRNVDYLIATRFGRRPGGGSLQRIAGAPAFVRGERDAELVLLHGLPLDADSWDALGFASALRPDLPGLGRSAPTMASPREWMEALLAGTAQPLVLVGHSLGTRYALEFAAAHPERVAGLVLVSPFFAQQPPPAIMRRVPSACLASRGLRKRHVAQLVGDHPAIVDAAWDSLTRPGAKSRFGRALATAHRVRVELQATLRTLAQTIPTVVIAGERDPLVADVGAARTVTLPGTGHFPQLDRPADVAREIEELLARAIGRTSAA